MTSLEVITPSNSLEEISGRSVGQRRNLSWWTSFMNFLHCPPGPMGHNCRSSSSSSSSGGNRGGGSYYNYYDNASGTSAATTGGSGSGGRDGGGWWNMDSKSGSGKSSYNEHDKSNSELADKGGSSWALFGGFMALMAAGMIAVAVVRKKSPLHACHPLRGSVNRRKNLFENVCLRRANERQVRNDGPSGDFNRMAEA